MFFIYSVYFIFILKKIFRSIILTFSNKNGSEFENVIVFVMKSAKGIMKETF